MGGSERDRNASSIRSRLASARARFARVRNAAVGLLVGAGLVFDVGDQAFHDGRQAAEAEHGAQ